MNVRLRYSVTFPAGVWFEEQLLMGNYTLTMNMTTQTLDPLDQNIALDRIKYFLLNEMHSTVFVSQAESDQAEAFAQLGMNVTTLPQEPVDQIVSIALYYKLNAIVEGRMKITELMFCSDTGDNIEYFHNENEHTDLFPAGGWWNQAGLTHSDIVFDEEDSDQAQPTAEEEWQEQELSWNQAQPTSDVAQVVFANFDQYQNETKH